MNSFSLEEEQVDSNYSRKMRLSFTNDAIDKVASVLGEHVPLAIPRNQQSIPQQVQQRRTLPVLPMSEEDFTPETSKSIDNEAIEATTNKVLNNNTTYDYFEQDGQGFLVSKGKDDLVTVKWTVRLSQAD
jgi:hypothetical protein